MAAASLLGAGAASGAAADAVPVRGVQVAQQTSGNLLGGFSDTTVTSFRSHPSGAYTLTFTERFTGCIDEDGSTTCDAGERAGTLEFSGSLSGTPDPSTPTGAGSARGIEHVTSGTGAFARARGVLTFHVDVQTGAIPFHGVIVVR
ncbi:MAG TPA: hypothetical protein PKD59_08510 [Miltoncostaeaceae bacterium]|nr:hypothetical protein [Miltoncostaeaceae bacterium]